MIELILIDDDLLIRKSWEFAAKKFNKNIRTFSSITEFQKNATQFSFDVPIYIDQDLGNGLLGVNESLKLKELGFNKLYLATGYPASSIDLPSHLLGITGKRPPFS